MEKMISVINDNLISVVNGIKEHKEQTEGLLANIKNEIDKKVDIAQEYKNNVEDAKNKIARTEAEIKDLEKDLEDLNQKFDGKDFREILNAGNKEINSKIIEKRKAISVQGKRILDVTDKAQDLKEEIVDLKNRKLATEEDLLKTNTLLNYYETNINNMIDFTTYHVDELEGYSIPNYGEEDIEDVDINRIEDGSIFEEIADISKTEPDSKLVDKALNDKEAFDEEFADLLSEEGKLDSDTMTDTLESIISTGKDIISSGKYVGMMDYLEEKEAEYKEKVVDEEVEDPIEISIDEEEVTTEPVTEEVEETATEAEPEEPVVEEDIPEDEVVNPEDINYDDFLISFEDVQEKLNSEDEEKEEPATEDEPEETEESDEETMDKYFKDDDFSVPGFEDEFEDQYEDSFPTDEVVDEEPVEETEEESKETPEIVPITEDLGSSDKDKIINLLLKTGVSEEEIYEYVKNFKDIDVDRLKREVENDKNREMADILVGVMPLQEDVIQDVLGLNDEQNKVLKKAAGRKYITINAFPDLVKHNFETIKNLGVKDPIGIFINHPGRFTMNPSNFDEILDKYDEEDLIRCLDKNGAVIDKL